MKRKFNMWSSKRKLFLAVIVVAMLAVLAISFISFFKTEETDDAEEKKPYDSMYNASRYFFRVFYPNDWDVGSDPYGFLMNADDGLVLELYPLQKILATPVPTQPDGSTPAVTVTPVPSSPTSSATADPRAGMERNQDLTMFFYYKEYDELYAYIKTLLPAGSAEPATPAPETPAPESTATGTGATPDGSAAPEQKKPPMDLNVIADYVFSQFQKDHEGAGYGYSGKQTYHAEDIEFVVLPYSYILNNVERKGELYVAARAMAYYIIRVDGTKPAFEKYNSVTQNILYNMKFSVFEY